MARQDEILEVIRALSRALPEVQGVMVASADGLPIAHTFGAGDAERVAAMSATALGLGTRIGQTTHLGGLNEVVIRGPEGSLVIYRVGERAAMAVKIPPQANIGLLHLEAREAARRLAELFARDRKEE